MKLETPNPIKQLENTIKWHEEQIELIKKAIVVLQGNSKEQENKYTPKQEPTEQKILRKIPWSKKIDKVFNEHDNLTIEAVIEKLIENGLDETTARKNRNIVYCTLMRKRKGKGRTLNRDEDGIYHRIRRRRTAPIFKPEDKGEAITN